MQRFCPVNHVLIKGYVSVKHNPKAQSQPENRTSFFSVKILMIFLFMQRFCLANHVSITSYASVKHNQKRAMKAGKSYVFFGGVNIFMLSFFMQGFFAVYLIFDRELCKRKMQFKKWHVLFLRLVNTFQSQGMQP